MELKFLHTSDWHLGINLSSLPAEKAEYRRQAAKQAISNMIAHALNENVNLVLISGDIFDTTNPSEKIKREFRNLVSPLISANIPIFVIPGNHDFYSKGGLWDKNEFPFLHVFKDDGFSYVNLDEFGLAVWGVPMLASNQDKNWLRVPPGIDNQRINILLYHGDFRGSGFEYEQWYYPFDLSDISASQFDYIALGHHHAFEEIKVLDKIKAVYTGTPIGWTFRKNECGNRFYVIGKIDKSHVDIKPCLIEVSRLHTIDVNVDYPSDIEKALKTLDSISDDDFVRVKVSGQSDPSQFLDLLVQYNAKFKFFKVDYDDTAQYESEISDNQHLAKLIEILNTRLKNGEIDEEYYSRVRSRAINLFMK